MQCTNCSVAIDRFFNDKRRSAISRVPCGWRSTKKEQNPLRCKDKTKIKGSGKDVWKGWWHILTVEERARDWRDPWRYSSSSSPWSNPCASSNRENSRKRPQRRKFARDMPLCRGCRHAAPEREPKPFVQKLLPLPRSPLKMFNLRRLQIGF